MWRRVPFLAPVSSLRPPRIYWQRKRTLVSMPAHWRQFLRNLLHDRWLQVVLLLGLLDLAFHLPRLWGAAAAPGAGLLQFAFYAALLALLVRTAARMLPRFMWAVRNRLLVTFFCLAVIPVLLTL